jgi:hypothetical protein
MKTCQGASQQRMSSRKILVSFKPPPSRWTSIYRNLQCIVSWIIVALGCAKGEMLWPAAELYYCQLSTPLTRYRSICPCTYNPLVRCRMLRLGSRGLGWLQLRSSKKTRLYTSIRSDKGSVVELWWRSPVTPWNEALRKLIYRREGDDAIIIFRWELSRVFSSPRNTRLI